MLIFSHPLLPEPSSYQIVFQTYHTKRSKSISMYPQNHLFDLFLYLSDIITNSEVFIFILVDS